MNFVNAIITMQASGGKLPKLGGNSLVCFTGFCHESASGTESEP